MCSYLAPNDVVWWQCLLLVQESTGGFYPISFPLMFYVIGACNIPNVQQIVYFIHLYHVQPLITVVSSCRVVACFLYSLAILLTVILTIVLSVWC